MAPLGTHIEANGLKVYYEVDGTLPLDRLQRKGFVGRKTDPKDQRYSRIFLPEEVKGYVRDVVPSRPLGPLLRTLGLISAKEREQILGGVRTLRRLLKTTLSKGVEDKNSEVVTPAREMEDRR